jgi:hypothetical protein
MYWDSKHWKEERSNILRIFKEHFKIDCCQRCGSKKNLTIHHKTYKEGIFSHNIPLSDYPRYFEVICNKCHYAGHSHTNKRDWKKSYSLK